jgi:hypothetical protein
MPPAMLAYKSLMHHKETLLAYLETNGAMNRNKSGGGLHPAAVGG